jgi:hypothetical protein
MPAPTLELQDRAINKIITWLRKYHDRPVEPMNYYTAVPSLRSSRQLSARPSFTMSAHCSHT